MKLFRVLVLALICTCFAKAPAQSIAVVYDFKAKTTTPVTVVAEKRVADNVFDIEWLDVDALLLAGASFGDSRKPVGSVAGALAIQPQISRNWFAQIGVAGRLEAGRPIASGILFGIGYRFRS